MRKLFWCCSAAGLLVVGGMFSVSYYACRNPESAVSHCLTTAANTSVVIQPVVGIGSVVARATDHVMKPHGPAACPAGSVEECVPADPEPVTLEKAREPADAGAIEKPQTHVPAPIVIPEEEPMPREEPPAPPFETLKVDLSKSACPVVMPYCVDDDDPMPKPRMPYADGEKNKGAEEEAEDGVMKAWKEFFKDAGPDNQLGSSEESAAAPAEKPSAEPKCQEDSHMHEHYPGCPSTTCPNTGKSHPSVTPDKKPKDRAEPSRKKVWEFEEESEMPPEKPKEHGKKAAPAKGCEGKNACPRTQGVDTMEYRRSDGGLNEYGPGPF